MTATSTSATAARSAAEVVKLSLGQAHSCARKFDGSVWCWGLNDQGQSSGEGEVVSTPRQVTGLTDVRHISAGLKHSCAVTEQGRILVLGANGYGQLGDGSREASRSPQRVQNLQDAALVAAGFWHTCALQQDGTARCWGRNQFGQLGNQNLVDQIAPGAVNNLAASINLAPGGHHTCGVGGTGQVACWGRATAGQLGDGVPQQGLRSSAGLVVGLAGVAQAASGREHTCVANTQGQIACWGYGFFGQLGNGSAQNAARPVAVPSAGEVTHLSAGEHFTVVATSDGQVRCWGANSLGQCGQGVVNVVACAGSGRWRRGRHRGRSGLAPRLRTHRQRSALLLGRQWRTAARPR